MILIKAWGSRALYRPGDMLAIAVGSRRVDFIAVNRKGRFQGKKWSNPEYFDKYQESKDRKMNAEELQKEEKQSHTIIKESHAQLAGTDDAAMDVLDDDDDFHVIFSG